MPTEEKHEIKMMYAVYADGRKEPIVINEIKDLSLEEAEPILEEYNFVKVTRCKDCKWHGYLTCSNPNGIKGWVTDECFCSFGERKDDKD